MRNWILSLSVAAALGLAAVAVPRPSLVQTFWKVQEQHPGLVPGVLRHLQEDLNGELLEASVDVHAAVVQRYPDLPATLVQWWEQEKALVPPRLSRPGVRTLLLQMAAEPGAPRTIVLEHFAKNAPLRVRCLATVSELVDKEYPNLPRQVRSREHQSVAHTIAKAAPGFGVRAAQQLSARHKQELQAAFHSLLVDLERDAQAHPNRWRERRDRVAAAFPGFPEEATAFHQARFDRLKTMLNQRYPDLRDTVRQTLDQKHAGLRKRAVASLSRHYPGLLRQILPF